MSVALKIAEQDFAALRAHLLRDDEDEHAAILLCGHVSTHRAETLLVRELYLVADQDFIAGAHGYRQIVPRVIAELSGRAAESRLSYVSIHSHPLAFDRNGLSRDDLASHQRLFPHLFDIIGDRPLGGVALGHASVAGEIWFAREGCARHLDELQVVGSTRRVLKPSPSVDDTPELRFDRQARLFGASGQRILRNLQVAVIGLGGGGSMITEQLAHLGIGQLTLVDFDVVKEINLNRVVGSRASDAETQTKKVEVAQRLVRDIDPTIGVSAIDGDLSDIAVAEALRDMDYVFLATDTTTSRLVFNALLHRYLIPGVQIGAKVETWDDSDPEVYLAVRPVYPDAGCLQCNGLIHAERLQVEARTDEEAVAQNYLDLPEVVDPAVISLNGIVASSAVTTMLFWATGLARPSLAAHRIMFARSGEELTVGDVRAPECPFCGRTPSSHFAAGDPVAALPVRLTGMRR